MAVDIQTRKDGRIVEVKVSGKLDAGDYALFVPEIERFIKKHAKIRILFEMSDFHGWSAGALWEDLKFDIKHFRDIERLAMVGDKKWENGMAAFCKPFTTAKVRYFDHSDAQEARAWVESEQAST